MVANEMRLIMADLGRRVNELIGRADLLKTDDAIQHWKSQGIDLAMLAKPEIPDDSWVVTQSTTMTISWIEPSIIINRTRRACPEAGREVEAELPIVNTNRVAGAMLSNQIIAQAGLADASRRHPAFQIERQCRSSLAVFSRASLLKRKVMPMTLSARVFLVAALSYPPEQPVRRRREHSARQRCTLWRIRDDTSGYCVTTCA